MIYRFEDLRERLERFFEVAGASREDALAIADEFLYAELSGRSTHGFSMIAAMVKRVHNTRDLRLEVSSPAEAVTMVAAKGQPGPAVARIMNDYAVSHAKKFGLGAAVAISSSPFLTAGYWPYQNALSGYTTIAASVAKAKVAPWGGTDAVMGTNPLGIGVPSADGPVVFDAAMTVIPAAEVRHAADTGSSIPPDVAYDKQGLPTCDPSAALEGSMIPFGGYKGSGLALMIEAIVGGMLGVKCGTHFGDQRGMVFLVTRTDLVRSTLDVERWVSGLSSDVRESRSLDGTPPRMPGSKTHAMLTDAKMNGFDLSQDAEKILNDLAI